MLEIAIVYFSAAGATAQLARAVAQGAGDFGAVTLYEIRGAAIVEGRFIDAALLARLDRSGAIIFGSPTYMGGPAAPFKAFADATSERWTGQRWANKVAAGFTCGACPNGDQAATLAYFGVLAAQHGMIWCNLDIPGGIDPQGRNRLGCQAGVVAEIGDGGPQAGDLLTAAYLGRRVARLAGLIGGMAEAR